MVEIVYGGKMKYKICIIGLGYVGLPLAVEFSKIGHNVIGVDINANRIEELKKSYDRNKQISEEDLSSLNIMYTTNIFDAKDSDFFIITVPTPVHVNKIPDLNPIIKASESVGKVISKGAIVILESTVYPGVTEEVVGQIIEKVSGLKSGIDFKLGYSPERVNPGDKTHTLKTVIKVVSGQDLDSLKKISNLYSQIVSNVFEAKSIKIAEASKILENTQRDVNIALMNEFALMFDKMKINIWDVIEAASTKWNFLRFTPGLVGGHCIPVDPYYIIHKSRMFEFEPKIITSARYVNDFMVEYIFQKILLSLNDMKRTINGSSILFLGITFKENIPDMRNSLNYKLAEKLKRAGGNITIVDPYTNLNVFRYIPERAYDVIVLAVPHDVFLKNLEKIINLDTKLFVDLKGILRNKHINAKYISIT